MKKLNSKAIWLFFIKDIWSSLILLLVLLYFLFTIKSPKSFIWLLWLIIPIGLFLTYICSYFHYYFYRYELKDKEFRKELGIIRKKYVSIPYDRIQNIEIRRDLWARILGLSTLYIETAGMSGIAASEASLPGILVAEAENLRDELIEKAQKSKNREM